MKYIDLHADTLAQAFLKGKSSISNFADAMVDGDRLYKASAMAQFFAIFMLPDGEEERTGVKIPEDDVYVDTLIHIMQNTIAENPEKIALARNAAEVEANYKMGKVSALLTIEDGRSVHGDMKKLENYFEKGIRLISLTWNFENCFGAPNSTNMEVMKKGLTAFGRDAVKRMEELGMLVDVSHLSDGGFYDVADILNVPFVASHSNCRELTNHPRNLTNDMIKVLGNKGGVAGINFFARFLNDRQDQLDSRIQDMVSHVKHLVNYGGEDIIAIGSDFDGISGNKFEVGNPLQMELLFEAMRKEGFTERQIEKFAYGNAFRVMRDVLK